MESEDLLLESESFIAIPPSIPPFLQDYRLSLLCIIMRKLALHASALNDAEYDLYTQSLKEIVLGDCDEGDDSARAGQKGEGGASGDAYYERMTVGVREARAWLRGRYSSLSAGVIDGVRCRERRCQL